MDEVAYAAKTDIAEEDVPEIHRAEAALADAIGALDVELEQLEQRLYRVLRQDDEVMGVDKEQLLTTVRPATTQVTDFLVAQRCRVEAETARVGSMLRRLGL